MKNLKIVLLSVIIAGSATLQNSLNAAADPLPQLAAEAHLLVLNRIALVEGQIQSLNFPATLSAARRQARVSTLIGGYGTAVDLNSKPVQDAIAAVATSLGMSSGDLTGVYTAAGVTQKP
ncbi:hypothetical protein K2X40_02800 [Candidatus Babeliales bacterium]|nr:hypothetical protein [Candidatus Babeliales bacterium]